MPSFINPILPRGFRKAKFKPYKEFNFDLPKPVRIFGLVPDSSTSYMLVDAAVDIKHEAISEITQHPVEIGADVTDFAIIQPRVLTLNGRISAVKNVKEGFESNPNEILRESPNRVALAWETLENALRNRFVLTIETPLKNYKNILIKDLTTSQDWRTVNVLDFTATIQEIITVAVTETQLSEEEIAEGSKQQASPTNDLGTIQTEEDPSIPSREQILGGS